MERLAFAPLREPPAAEAAKPRQMKRPRSFDARGADPILLHTLSDDEKEEYDRNTREKYCKRAALNSAGAGAITDPYKGVRPKTLQMALNVFDKFCKGAGEPLLATDKEQIAHWEKQTIIPSQRTILVRRNGENVKSPRYMHMVWRGVTAELKAVRRAAQSTEQSAKMKGHPQRNSMEGCAIRLFRELIAKCCPAEAKGWEFEAVQDGMLADVMAHHTTWPMDQWVAIQFKSASIKFGAHVKYNLSVGAYPDWVFCVGVGLLDYVPSTPTGPNDLDSNARVYEIWNVGRAANLSPHPATAYKGIDQDRRTFASHTPHGVNDSAEYVQAGLQRLLADLKAWPEEHRRSRMQIQYELSPPGANKQKTESTGIKVIVDGVKKHGYDVRAPWRQNETVDTIMRLKTEAGVVVTYASNKTGTIANGDYAQRTFMLGGGKYYEFCDVIIASYAGEHTRVALMLRDAVYGRGKKYFCWNERDGTDALAAKGVRIFDLAVEAEAKAFCAAVELAGTLMAK